VEQQEHWTELVKVSFPYNILPTENI